ncbi:hypothetical protein AB0E08_07650 [Streptomyces sp. NPDC048281]|uniref:hypothetical protein n=1 Tax=Streptomyces sp. NPDC048281 TaxID=3154715 RepID=UPI0034287FD1
MTKDVSPQEETTGTLTATYWLYVSVGTKEEISAAAKALEEPLRQEIAESHPGRAGCATVVKVTNVVPPAGSSYTGWTVMVTVIIDLTVWRRDLGLVDGRYASMTVRDLLADVSLLDAGARIDNVETKMLAHAPA